MPRVSRATGAVPDDRPPGVFELSQSDRQSEIWRRLYAELTKRLNVRREENDGQLDEAQTARVRGHIECIKDLLALGDEPPPFQE